MRKLIALAGLFAAMAEAFADAAVTLAVPREVPEAHWPKVTRGKDYRTWFYSHPFSDPRVPLKGKWDNPEIARLPMFRDCAIVFWSNYLEIPKDKATWRTVAENFGGEGRGSWNNFNAAQADGRTVSLMFHPKCRTPETWVGEIDLDYGDYVAWKAKQRTLESILVQSEWVVDLTNIMLNRKSPKYSDRLKAKLEELWTTYRWNDRYDHLALAKWYMDRKLALHYGDTELFESFRSANFVDHLAAARGAKVLVSETTNTSDWNAEYRWDVSPMFIRGAARQFGISWKWYVALFFNGPNSTGGWENNASPGFGPKGVRGVSPSAERRVCHFAYLNGANGVEPESWSSCFFEDDPATGKVRLSERGRDFAAFHDFTAAHPGRGAPYDPVAILVPLAQGYNTCGGKPWGFCDWSIEDEMVDGVFFTACPAFSRRELMKSGKEGNLHNSRFAQMYDVLVPDTDQTQADFLAALDRYPAAILTGKYAKETDLATPLRKYVENGGTLVLNAAYFDRGFGPDFTGVKTDGPTFECLGEFEDFRGKRFPVSGRYDAALFSPLPGTEVVAKDAEGRALITVARRGRGRVVAVAPLWMAPRIEVDAAAEIDRIRNGKKTFPFTEYVLARLQHDLFPIRVRGDCQYGLNRTRTGWWLWVLNNKGVTKFTDTAQVVDPAGAVPVRIELSDIRAESVRELMSGQVVKTDGAAFSWRVPSGDLAIFEIREMSR